jgi:hypothetical protein
MRSELLLVDGYKLSAASVMRHDGPFTNPVTRFARFQVPGTIAAELDL